ncbi:Uncharacterised protein [Raoultella ornithinolytica]|nr:Uncharacterised protein [Raoultella ornithinolytica]
MRAEITFLFTAGSNKANAVVSGHIFQPLGQLQQYAHADGIIVDALQGQAAKVAFDVSIAHGRIGVEVRHHNDLLASRAFMGGNDGAAGDVLPVFPFIRIAVDITRVEAADVALIAHLGKLLTHIVRRQHFSGRTGHSSGKNSRDMTSLGICGFAHGAESRGGEDKTCAKRQGKEAAAQRGKHSGGSFLEGKI